MKYFKTHEKFVYKLPKNVGLKEGVIMEPLAVAVHVAKMADVKLGDEVGCCFWSWDCGVVVCEGGEV